MKILAMMATTLGYVGSSFWSIPVCAQDFPAACNTTAPCLGYDWHNGSPGGTGGIVSSTNYMASHRFQRHSVVTSDGAIHIIVNTGLTAGNALQLFSSPDNGTTWYPTYTFVGTETLQANYTVSTDDVALRTDAAGNQYLEVAYDQEPAGGANALMFTELVYTPPANATSPPSWAPAAKYFPQTVISSSSSPPTFYQQPGFTTDQNGNFWLADLELQFGNPSYPNTPSVGGIAVYQRNGGTWGSVAVNIPNNTTPPNLAPSANVVSSQGSNAFAHAPRPVFVQSENSTGTIGLLFQSSTPTAQSSDCLYWVTISGSAASGATSSNAQELSHYSNSPASSNCNLPAAQGTYPDTAFSDATNAKTGDQYLGFVINYPSGSSSGEAVFAMSYQESSGTWSPAGSTSQATLNYNNSIYVKSVYAVVGLKSYSYLIINNGPPASSPTSSSSLELFESPTLSATVTSTLYSPLYALTWTQSGSFANPRIEAPQYINSNANSNSMALTVPIWLQYANGGSQSLLYWNDVPN